MTVMYTHNVATATFGCFLKLLIGWRGSIYKLIWKEFAIYIFMYATISCTYRFALDEQQRSVFEEIVVYCRKYYNKLNLAFVLAFYGDKIMSRWRKLFDYIPWPDDTAQLIASYIQGTDDRGRLMRRTILRYVNLSYVISMRSISVSARKRFPTLQHLTHAGLMLEAEEKTLESIKTPFNKYPIPIVWALSIVNRAEKERRISHKFSAAIINQAIMDVRFRLGRLFMLDFVAIPIVYTQVITLCTYLYFAMTLMALQFVSNTDSTSTTAQPSFDAIIPFDGIVQFIVYMGWLKVAEVMINPFGEDDDDFDINSYIDRNLQYSYLVVDEMHEQTPDLVKDHYWDDIEFELPYTLANKGQKQPIGNIELGSAAGVTVTVEKSAFVTGEDGKPLPTIKSGTILSASKTLLTSSAEKIQSFIGHRSKTDLTSPAGGQSSTSAAAGIGPTPVTSRQRRRVSIEELAPVFHAGKHHATPFDNRFEETRDIDSKPDHRGIIGHLHDLHMPHFFDKHPHETTGQLPATEPPQQPSTKSPFAAVAAVGTTTASRPRSTENKQTKQLVLQPTITATDADADAAATATNTTTAGADREFPSQKSSYASIHKTTSEHWR